MKPQSNTVADGWLVDITLYHSNAISIAKSMHRRIGKVVDLDDLVQDANIGLIQAAKSFEPGRGLAFTTHLQHRVRGAILDGIRQRDIVSRRQRATGNVPTFVPLNKPLYTKGRECACVGDMIVGRDEPPDKAIARSDEFSALIRCLPGQERDAVFLYFHEGLTMRQVGLVMRLCESRISQLVSSALRILKADLTRASEAA